MPNCWFCRALAHNIIIMSTEGTQRVIAQESVVGCLGRGRGRGRARWRDSVHLTKTTLWKL